MASPSLKSSVWRLGVPVVVAGAGIAAGLLGRLEFKGDGNAAYFPWDALTFSSAAVLLVFVTFDVVAGRASSADRKGYGWVNAVLGSDGRVSTSRFQVFLWTLILAAALLYLTGVAIFSIAHDDRVLDNTDWNDYLILLGGPFAASVISKFVVRTKVEEGAVQKTVLPTASVAAAVSPANVPAAGTPKAADVVTNDAGELDLIDSQYLVFNLVAAIYVSAVFVSRILDKSVTDAAVKYSLPKVPAVLLGLTSAAAATYVANKAALKSPPLISTTNPSPPVAGGSVEILGTNLVPAGSDQATVASTTLVIVEGQGQNADHSVLPAAEATPTKVTFTMPGVHRGKTVDIQVITTANVATGRYRTEVM